MCFYKYNYKYEYFKSKKIEVEIINLYNISENGITYEIKYNGDSFLLYIKDKNEIYKYGDRLEIVASNYEIEDYGNPYEFNYKRYLNSKGFVSRIYCNKVMNKNSQKGMLSLIHYIRNIISDKLMNNMSYENANILKSLIYGDDLLLEDETKELFSDIGIGHYLCVSGAHVIFLLNMYEIITRSKKFKVGKVLLLVYFYFISLFNISLLRAIIMNFLAMFKKYKSFYIRYVYSLIIVLLINPYYIFNIGIIFSFLSILGIYIFNPVISSFFKIKFRIRIFDSILNSLSVTISAQILILPFEISCFGKICLISIFSNIILSVILNLLMISGFSLFILFFIPVLSEILINSCNILVSILVFLVNVINNVNYLDIYLPKFNIIEYFFYYLFIILLIFSNRIWIRFWNRRKLFKSLIWIIQSICISVIMFYIVYTNYFESYVIYFNIGQGNMALIHDKITNIIVDMGSTEKGKAYSIMNNFLKAKNIYNIDLILITHMHTDHINGLEELLANTNINVKRVGFSTPCEAVEEYDILINNLNENNVSKINVKEGDIIKLNQVLIEVLGPPKDRYIKDSDMLNANSNVYLITKNDDKFLFMGDCTKESEKYILENYKEKLENVKAYQVSHHGSNTSSYEPFVSSINECSAIISAKKSVYGHPSETVVELLKRYRLNIYITEENGAIIF